MSESAISLLEETRHEVAVEQVRVDAVAQVMHKTRKHNIRLVPLVNENRRVVAPAIVTINDLGLLEA